VFPVAVTSEPLTRARAPRRAAWQRADGCCPLVAVASEPLAWRGGGGRCMGGEGGGAFRCAL